MKRLLIAALACGLLAATAVAQTSPIRIGSTLPLTGNLAFFGQHSRWGTELAVSEANAAGGVLGRQVEVDYQDNQCNPAVGVSSVTRMLSDKTEVALLDGVCSSVILAIMPVVQRAGVPLIVANGSATAIADASGVGGNKWTFKVNPSDVSLTEALVGWLQQNGKADGIGFLGEDTDYGRAGVQAFEQALGRRGLKLGSVDYYQQGTADFTTVLTKVRRANPKSLALYSVGADFQNLIRQYYGMGLTIPLTGRLLTDQIPAEILSSGKLDGATAVQPYTAEIDLPANHDFIAAFQKMHGAPPNLLSYEAYETTRVLLDAIRRSGNADPAAIRDALQTTKLHSILGAEIQFDDHNLAHNNAVIVMVKDGKVQVVGLSKT
jgi:branched-chain amino acid transport system substrate-binding protein